MLTTAIVANICIALSYLGLGVWVTPKFDAAAPTWGLATAKAAGLIFFITCAFSHLEMAEHAWTGTPMDFAAPHYVVVHVVQAISAPTFLVFATFFMSIRIFNRTLYTGLLDRAIEEQSRNLERMVLDLEDPSTPSSDGTAQTAGRALGHLTANAIALSVGVLNEIVQDGSIPEERRAEVQPIIDRLLEMSTEAKSIHAAIHRLDTP